MTPPQAWQREDRRLLMFIRNIGSRYMIILLSAAMGLVVVPFNLKYLGESAYGLWLLAVSITTWFSVLELGYGSATVKYVAEYRAKGDARALNEVASTTFYLFTALGLLCYAVAAVIAFLLPQLFNLSPGQERTGQIVLLIIGSGVALHFVFAIYGGVVNGFERNYKNFLPGAAADIVAAGANISVLLLGYGLVELVAVTTVVRMVPYWFYRRNAYVVFPQLDIRFAHLRRDRLRELTGFSAYLAVIDWSSRLTYTSALIILAYFLNTAAVAIYSIGEKVTHAVLRVTNQLHPLLFPAVVHRSVEGSLQSQRQLIVRASRFQLAVAVALAGAAAALAEVLVPAWVDRGQTLAGLQQSVQVLHVLAVVVVLRTWMAMPSMLLKATGHHKFVAFASAWTGVASVLLSVVLVRSVGLVGVAWGMLIPVAALTSCAIFPRACSVLRLPLWQGYREIVWPAIWPAIPVIFLLILVRDHLATRMVVVLPCLAAGVLLYATLFLLWGLEREERKWMWTTLLSLRRGRPPVLAQA